MLRDRDTLHGLWVATIYVWIFKLLLNSEINIENNDHCKEVSSLSFLKEGEETFVDSKFLSINYTSSMKKCANLCPVDFANVVQVFFLIRIFFCTYTAAGSELPHA